MSLLHAAKKKTLLPIAKQTAKISSKKFESLMRENPILCDCFWEFVLDVDNLLKWQEESINILLAYTTPQGFAKIANKPSLQQKLLKKSDKLISRFPQLSHKISNASNKQSSSHNLPIATPVQPLQPLLTPSSFKAPQNSLAQKALESYTRKSTFGPLLFWGAIIALSLWLISGVMLATLALLSVVAFGYMTESSCSSKVNSLSLRF